MKSKEVREKTDDELTMLEENLEEEIFNLRFQQHTSRLENTSRVKSVRRDLARVKTILNDKQHRKM